MSIPLLDKVSHEIEEGSWIVYPTLFGSSAHLRIGKVVKVKQNRHVTVQGIEDGWGGYQKNPKLCDRKGTLQFSDRIVVLKDDMIPKQYKELFE